MLKILVKCVCCGFEKWVGEEQKEMPMCDKCFSPMVAQEAKRGFTLAEIMIVVAIISMLAAIALPVKRATHTTTRHITREGGGDTMFKFIELFVFVAILWIIANLLHYVFMRSTGWSAEDSPMAWLFGLSNGWIKKDTQRKAEMEEQSNTKRKDSKR